MKRASRVAPWWGFAFFLIVATATRIRQHGRISFRIAPEILSATGSSPEVSDRFFEFLGAVSSRLPRGARVACVWSGNRSRYHDDIAFRSAVGRLPSQVVVPAGALEASEPPDRAPDFVASFGGPFEDPRYALRFRASTGAVYGKAP